MECLYIKQYNNNSRKLQIPDEEINHLKALHLNQNEKLIVSNGNGLLGLCEIEKYGKEINLKILETYDNFQKPKIDVAFGVIKNRDRFEFAIEKSVELGIEQFIPLNTRYTEKKTIKPERLKSKMIAAMKQSKRAYLPNICNLKKLDEIDYNKYDNIILADINGKKINDISINGKCLILIGPEGGFHNNELEELNKLSNLKKLKLSDARLRAETALITSLSLVSNLIY